MSERRPGPPDRDPRPPAEDRAGAPATVTRVYLCAPFTRQAAMRIYRRLLEQDGLTSTARWLDMPAARPTSLDDQAAIAHTFAEKGGGWLCPACLDFELSRAVRHRPRLVAPSLNRPTGARTPAGHDSTTSGRGGPQHHV